MPNSRRLLEADRHQYADSVDEIVAKLRRGQQQYMRKVGEVAKSQERKIEEMKRRWTRGRESWLLSRRRMR